MKETLSIKEAFGKISYLHRALILFLLLALGAGVYLLGYRNAHNQYINDVCGKILGAQYSDIKSDDWMALKLGKEECIKKLIKQ